MVRLWRFCLLDSNAPVLSAHAASSPPRARGTVRLGVRTRDDKTVLQDLYQSGSMKALFPHGRECMAVFLNTAGGVTGGDNFEATLSAKPGSALTVTTQAAERFYRAQPGQVGTIRNSVQVDAQATMHWLPQETLIYDRASVDRHLQIDITAQSRALIVEPVILGRAAMGETVTQCQFRDRIDLTCDGQLIYADRSRIDGDALRALSGPATAAGSAAYATVIYAAPDALRFLDAARALMPATGGVSALSHTLIVARIVAPDGYELRQSLIPLIGLFRDSPLPRTWTI